MQASQKKTADRPANGARRVLRRILGVPELSVLVALVLLLIIFTLENKVMLSRANIETMLRTMAYPGIVVVGMTFLIIAGEIDLSVGGMYALTSAIAGYGMVKLGWPILPTLAVALLAGMAVGLFNGVITVKLGLPAFIVTLGTMFATRSVANVLTEGNYISGLPPEFTAVGKATPLGLSWSLLVFLALVILGDFILRQTIFGSMVTATGGNKQAARVTGINTDWVKISCFVVTALLATVSGLLVTAMLSAGESQIGQGLELDVIASTVIGGASLFGGVGSVLGTFLGTALMQVIRSGLVIAGVNIDWQNVAVGTILAAAASVDLLRRRAKKY